jgi:hypothetical protein
MSEYARRLERPEWQRRRLEVMNSYGFRCARCADETSQLHVHHKLYVRGREPWEYEDALLECLCSACHEKAHAAERQVRERIALQPTAHLPLIAAAVEAVGDALLAEAGGRTFIDALNRLQDAIDDYRDFRRGPGGA